MNLTVRSGPDMGASIGIDRRLTIGREGDFRLIDPTVSRMHAAVTPAGGGKVILEDLGSTGGTVVNGNRLFGPVTLQGGEQILMGGSMLEFVADVPEAAAPPAAAPPGAAPPPAAPPAAEPPVTAPIPPAVPSEAPMAVPGVVPPPPTPSPMIPPAAPPPAGRDRKKLLLLAVVVAIVVAGVVAFVLLSGGDDADAGGGGGDGAAAATGGGGDGEALAPLSNLGATPDDFTTDPTTWTVTLGWDAAPEALGLDHYEVSRDGKRIAADVPEETFIDDGVVPGQELNYDVVGVGSAGTTEVASTVVVTPELAVGDSLIDGPWKVEMRITKSNLQDVGASAVLTWDFTPSCAFGACDATFTIRRTDLIGAIALIAGTQGKYTGVGSGEFLLDDCRGDPAVEDITVDLTVRKADVQAGVWAAQTFQGRLVEVAEASGCITARRTFTISGTRA